MRYSASARIEAGGSSRRRFVLYCELVLGTDVHMQIQEFTAPSLATVDWMIFTVPPILRSAVPPFAETNKGDQSF